MTQTKVTEYEVVDHGVENSQYFQGCGVVFAKFDECVTGCGDDFQAAFDDALESLAQAGVDAHELEIRAKAEGVAAFFDGDSVGEDSEDCCYYVSIRYSVA